jgi:hypothetical protein
MGYFGSADDVYETLGQLLRDAATSQGLGPQLQQTNASVRLALSDPDARVTLVFAQDQDPVVEFGNSALNPTLTLEMSADTAHEVFLGKLSFFEAVRYGRLTQHGPSASFSAVWPIAEFTLPARYAQVLAAAGRGDLIGAQ